MQIEIVNKEVQMINISETSNKIKKIYSGSCRQLLNMIMNIFYLLIIQLSNSYFIELLIVL